jgi:acyl-CoA reductase-like NAD-dependent aldehyde dehydrogenase
MEMTDRERLVFARTISAIREELMKARKDHAKLLAKDTSSARVLQLEAAVAKLEEDRIRLARLLTEKTKGPELPAGGGEDTKHLFLEYAAMCESERELLKQLREKDRLLREDRENSNAYLKALFQVLEKENSELNKQVYALQGELKYALNK